ncbi:MAG TPA: nucleoside 2-deoxyribosyltransferase [Pyrinomonadaceae bacterium]
MPDDTDIPASADLQTTSPKPFVFVLMPFRADLRDVYLYGIKAAADEVGAYAERVDEQRYAEGILDRIYNQINKADVIVADMTGQNPNVFYEVGYAHALGKIVLLVTQNTDDIPFDLKHRHHIVYGGSIEKLRQELAPWLQWAIAESKNRAGARPVERFSLSVLGVELSESKGAAEVTVVRATGLQVFWIVQLPVNIRNGTPGVEMVFTHAYLFAPPNAPVKVLNPSLGDYLGAHYESVAFAAHPADAYDGLTRQHALDGPPLHIPYAAVASFSFTLEATQGMGIAENFRLRMLRGGSVHDFPFRLEATFEPANNVDVEKGPPLEAA